MKQLLILALLFANISSCLAQSIRSVITGEWTTGGSANLFDKNDTIAFHQDINFWNKNHLCSTLDINFSSKKKIIVSDVTHCTEPGTVKTYNAANRYRIIKQKDKILLTIFINEKYEKRKQLNYFIVSIVTQQTDSYPFEIKTLKLIKAQI